MPSASGQHEGGDTAPGLQVRVGRVLQEDAQDGEVAVVRGSHERGVAKAASILLLLLQHSANPDLQSGGGVTALMQAARGGQMPCVQALLRAKANTELLDGEGHTALWGAEEKGHTATAALIQQHTAACLDEDAGLCQREVATILDKILKCSTPWYINACYLSCEYCSSSPPSPPPLPPSLPPLPPSPPSPPLSLVAWLWVVLWVMLGTIATVAFSRTLMAGGQHRADRQRRPHRLARKSKAHGRTNTAEPIPAAALAPPPAAAPKPAAAASKARDETVAAAVAPAAARKAAAAAVANADARDRATGNDGEGGSNGATGSSKASGAAEVPDDYICPITAEIMTDPVCTMDGFTYERAAITEWLRTNSTSPSTGALLESTTLIPNHLVRSLLRAFNEAPATAPT